MTYSEIIQNEIYALNESKRDAWELADNLGDAYERALKSGKTSEETTAGDAMLAKWEIAKAETDGINAKRATLQKILDDMSKR